MDEMIFDPFKRKWTQLIPSIIRHMTQYEVYEPLNLRGINLNLRSYCYALSF